MSIGCSTVGRLAVGADRADNRFGISVCDEPGSAGILAEADTQQPCAA
jgi:hypothetical protein